MNLYPPLIIILFFVFESYFILHDYGGQILIQEFRGSNYKKKKLIQVANVKRENIC